MQYEGKKAEKVEADTGRIAVSPYWQRFNKQLLLSGTILRFGIHISLTAPSIHLLSLHDSRQNVGLFLAVTRAGHREPSTG